MPWVMGGCVTRAVSDWGWRWRMEVEGSTAAEGGYFETSTVESRDPSVGKTPKADVEARVDGMKQGKRSEEYGR